MARLPGATDRESVPEAARPYYDQIVDSRPVWGIHTGTPVSDAFRTARKHRGLLRQLARMALFHRPPTGFLRGLVVEHSGEHRARQADPRIAARVRTERVGERDMAECRCAENS